MKLEDVQASAMKLPDAQRATLATELLCSLPAVLMDEDDGVAEARRRSRELAENPAAGSTWEKVRRDLGR
ncbi:MAG: addiction module protein [Kiritimatiellia bacterium]